jgi:Rrf2 family protein
MRITKESDYAIRVVLYLSQQNSSKKTNSKIISETENIPLRFLLKILRKLTKSGIVKSFYGVGGGYIIAKTPNKISLKEIIESIEGPITINRCLYDPEFCNLNRINSCVVHNAFLSVQSNLIKDLESITIKKLLLNISKTNETIT